MPEYKTSEIAGMTGIHPNTVRFYEEWGLITKPERKENGYRVFTALHLQQIRLARTAFQIEVVQNGLRKKIVDMVKTAAKRDFDGAILLTREYLDQIQIERRNAEEAIGIVRGVLSRQTHQSELFMGRKEASKYLGVTMDTLRNWEMNGLLRVGRRENGYRVYTNGDIRRLKIIRALRCANYSLEAILRMLRQLSQNPNADIREALNAPGQDEGILSVCDKLLDSLSSAEKNAHVLMGMLEEMKRNF